jgi:hypothetical protein
VGAAAEQQPRLSQPVEAQSQFGIGPPCYDLDQLVAELAAEHGAHLPNLLGNRSEAV